MKRNNKTPNNLLTTVIVVIEFKAMLEGMKTMQKENGRRVNAAAEGSCILMAVQQHQPRMYN